MSSSLKLTTLHTHRQHPERKGGKQAQRLHRYLHQLHRAASHETRTPQSPRGTHIGIEGPAIAKGQAARLSTMDGIGQTLADIARRFGVGAMRKARDTVSQALDNRLHAGARATTHFPDGWGKFQIVGRTGGSIAIGLLSGGLGRDVARAAGTQVKVGGSKRADHRHIHCKRRVAIPAVNENISRALLGVVRQKGGGLNGNSEASLRGKAAQLVTETMMAVGATSLALTGNRMGAKHIQRLNAEIGIASVIADTHRTRAVAAIRGKVQPKLERRIEDPVGRGKEETRGLGEVHPGPGVGQAGSVQQSLRASVRLGQEPRMQSRIHKCSKVPLRFRLDDDRLQRRWGLQGIRGKEFSVGYQKFSPK